MRRLLWAIHLVVAVMGAAVAIASIAVHRIDVPLLGLSAPVGLLLGLATSFAMVWALRLMEAPSRVATSFAVGWLAMLGFVLVGRPEGDFLVAGDGAGYALMAAGLLMVMFGLFAGRRDADSRSGATPT